MKKHRSIVILSIGIVCLAVGAAIALFLKNIQELDIRDEFTRAHQEYTISETKDLVIDIFDCGEICISKTVVYLRSTNEDGTYKKEKELLTCEGVLAMNVSTAVGKSSAKITRIEKRVGSTCPYNVGDTLTF